MARLQAIDDALSSLASQCGPSDTSITLATGEGAGMGFPATGDYMLYVGDANTHEIMRATSRSGDVIQVTRTGSETLPAASTVFMVISADVYDELWDGLVCRADGSLSSGSANDYAFNWQNPHTFSIVIIDFMIRITTSGGASSVIDVGTTTATGTNSDNIINGESLYTASPPYIIYSLERIHMDENGGTNDWLTGQILTADSGLLTGKYYISYIPL